MNERCIYLVRHGETSGESSIRFHGRNDVPLSDHGRRQVSGLVELVRLVRFAAVVHSPLSRARESAEILIAGIERRPAIVEEAHDLAEVDFGVMEGMTEAEIAVARPEWYAEWKAGSARGFPEGESFAGFDARVRAAFDGLLARHPSGHLLIVAHKGIIKRGAGHLLRMSPEAVAGLNPELGSLTVLSSSAVAGRAESPESGVEPASGVASARRVEPGPDPDPEAGWALKHWSLTNDSS